jgi:hypothetical protein
MATRPSSDGILQPPLSFCRVCFLQRGNRCTIARVALVWTGSCTRVAQIWTYATLLVVGCAESAPGASVGVSLLDALKDYACRLSIFAGWHIDEQ